MRILSWHPALLLPPLIAAFALASDQSTTVGYPQDLLPRDSGHSHGGHAHGHHAAPILEFNSEEWEKTHFPTPPSYYSIDIMDPPGSDKRYPGLMGLHALFMSLAFFGALPIGIALRSVKHSCHGFTVVAFYTFLSLGLSSSALYRKLTPNMYQGSKHGSQGYFFIACALALSAVDVFSLLTRLVTHIRSIRRGEERFSLKPFWNHVILNREGEHTHVGATGEYTHLAVGDPDMEEVELAKDVDQDSDIHLRRQASLDDHDDTEQWANRSRHARHPSYPHSTTSERTLFGAHSPRRSDDSLPEGGHIYPWQGKDKCFLFRYIGRATFAIVERVLVVAGFMQVTTGIVVYTGGCRGDLINSCLAHLIKGGIFWCYGLLTFARFLGSFSELGWAWNRAPRNHGRYPTAEFVESAVIFTYGITNTWMERFAASPGDPYTTKQMQHISIAVMFWFAGLLGMGIESKRMRRWLAAGSTTAVPAKDRSREAVAEPPSYVASFNPFPALCIGITGAAMSAHFQTYLFQVQIHMLWGYLLCGFAVLRCLTYAFLWVGPPRSILPSRPPTEALASFMLALGGLEFMFSSEELAVAAMRQGHDDAMMFLNVGVAVTCLVFCWTLFVVGFKGWLKSRTQGAMQFHSSA